MEKNTKSIIANIKQRMLSGDGMLKTKKLKKSEKSSSDSEDYSDTENEPTSEYCPGISIFVNARWIPQGQHW